MDRLTEVHGIEHDRRILTDEVREWAVTNRHIENPTHRPVYGDEFYAAREREEIYRFTRQPTRPERGSFRGEGPGGRLYRTGIMRGYYECSGERHLRTADGTTDIALHSNDRIRRALTAPSRAPAPQCRASQTGQLRPLIVRGCVARAARRPRAPQELPLKRRSLSIVFAIAELPTHRSVPLR